MISSSGGGRYMAYSPSPSAPHSPHLSGLRSASSAALVAEQEKYLAELLAERHKLSPFMPVLPNCCRLLNQDSITDAPTDVLSEQLRLERDDYYQKMLKRCTYHRHSIHKDCETTSPNQKLRAFLRYKDSILSSDTEQLDPLVLLVFLPPNNCGSHVRVTHFSEILRVTTLLGNASVLGQSGLEHASPMASGGIFSNGGADVNGWASRFQSEMSGLIQPSSTQNWLSSQGSSSGLIVKRTIRVDIPVDKYPNYNFVGRLLGPRGNSLKRMEATTECRVLIRGCGSIKDPAREEIMRGKPGYEHLNEPLHIIVEAELPVEIIDARLLQAREVLEDLLRPVDESQDFYKKQQLRELAMLNGTLREEGSPMSGSVSPFNNSLGMKRAKTRG